MAGNPDGGGSSQKLRVLFLGNSYTSFNDLPTVVGSLSRSSQSPVRIEVDQHTPGGQTWEGHDADPEVTALIGKGWDYVVLQDQSDLPWSVPNGIKDALRSLDAKIKAAGAKTLLYMTWAKQEGVVTTRTGRFTEDVQANLYYMKHAEAVGADVAPVGRAWERALRDPQVSLYSGDGSHPTAQGTYLAACVFYAVLTGQSPLGLPDGGLAIDAATAAKLQGFAWDTLQSRKRPAAPLVGAWPLSNTGAGSDLVLASGVRLGDTAGPMARPRAATQFAAGTYVAAPYFTGLNAPHITASFHASREDWSAPVADPQYLLGKFMSYEIYQQQTVLYARVYTGASGPPRAVKDQPVKQVGDLANAAADAGTRLAER